MVTNACVRYLEWQDGLVLMVTQGMVVAGDFHQLFQAHVEIRHLILECCWGFTSLILIVAMVF